MASAFINHVTIVMFVGLLVWAAVSDFRTYLIPNSISVSVAVLYAAHVIASPVPVDWLGALLVAAIVLVIGFALFASRYVGGGDVKLLVATSLWAGSAYGLAFVMLTTFIGGVLAMMTATHIRFFRPWPAAALAPDEASALKLRTSVPYGIAIALSGVWLAAETLLT